VITHGGTLSIYTELQPDDVLLLALYGELDRTTTRFIDREVNRAEGSLARQIVIDLSGLDIIDSTGLEALVDAHARSQANGGRVGLLHGSAQVEKTVAASGLADVLPFVD
jgi:anti-anti-sigma factor